MAVIWGFFIYSAATSGLAPGSPALIRAAVEAIAATIITLLLIVLSINPIGAIVAAVLALVDLILTLVCETGHDELRDVPGLGGACFTLTTAITKVITGLIYNYELMVSMSKDDLMVTGSPNLTLTNPSQGFVAGNTFTLTLPVTTTVHHQRPGTDDGSGPIIVYYPYLFSADNLKSSTFRYKLFDPTTETGTTAVDLNQMTSDWQNVVLEETYLNFSLYEGQAAALAKSQANSTLTAGVNAKLPLKLGMSYAVPAYECWTLILIPVCYAKEYEGSTTDIPLDSIRYDVFPATLSEFLTLGNKPDGGRGLAWDPSFGSLPDSDGDGLRGSLFNGLDPNDQTWDADSDGLSDAAELQIRQAGEAISPIVRDTDNDGLTDGQEIAIGSDPALADTDNDGLADGVETRHQVVGADGKLTATWAGGWQVTINSTPARTIWVSSSPFGADSDQDGVSDQAERGLAGQLDNQNRPYHPNVYNASPLAVLTDSSDLDGYLAPGQSFQYTSTVIANVPVAPGVLNVTAPAVLGGGPLGAPNPAALPFDPLTFSNSQTVTVDSSFTVAAPGGLPATGQSVVLTSTATTRLPNIDASWTWGALTNDQLPPVNAPFVLRDSAVTVSRADRGDSYLFSGQSVDSNVTNNDAPGHFPGDLFAYSVPGGVTRQLDQDTDDLQSRFGAFTPPEPNGAFLRGKTNSSVACNNAGQCMVVWEHLAYCHTATINGVNVVATGDEPAVEPLIFLVRDPNDNNPLDGGFEMIWTPPTNLGVGFHTGGNVNPLPYTFAFCGKTNLYVSEYDTGDLTYVGPDPTGRDWSGMNFLGWHTLNPLEWNSSKLLDYGGFGGYDFKLSVNQGVPSSGQQRVIAAAMLAPDGTISKPQFQISPVRSFFVEEASDANFNPVVTSDGGNFLVAWENLSRAPGAFKSGINARLFDGTGNPLTNDQPDLDQVPLDTTGATGGIGVITQSYADLAALWADDQYIVTRQMIQRTGVTFSNPSAITSRRIDGNGVYVAGSTTTLVTDATARAIDTFGLAWDPTHRNALLVYTAPASQVKALVFGQDNAGPLFVNDGVQPQAAYHPASQSWLVSYKKGSQTEFRQFPTNLGASFVSGTPPVFTNDLSTNNLACPAAASAPVVDLRFEELPSATTFTDSSGYGNAAVCDRGCPAAGLPGAPNAPLSDYAIKFNRADPRLTVNTAVADSFTLAMWIKAPSIGGDEAYFVEQGNGTASDWSLGMSNGLLRLKLGGQVLTSASPRIDNDQWHFVTATRNQATGQVALYVDGVSVATATFTTNRLTGSPVQYIGGDFFGLRSFGGFIDHLQLFGIDLAADAVQALYNRTAQSYCVASGIEGIGARDNIYWTRLPLNQQDTRGGRITATGTLRLQIDADKPTASITSVSNNEIVGTGQVIGGTANDPSAGVGKVEVQVNGGAWQPAFGANTWTFSLAGLSGDVDLRVRATDSVGNIGDPSAALRVHIDTTAPIVALDPTPNTIKPTKNAAGIWQVTLNGSVNDNLASNINATSLLVQLTQQSGVGVLPTQQAAAVSGNRWTINYLLDANVYDPTGVYTATAQVQDSVGLLSNITTSVVRLDATGPVAHLSAIDASRSVISQTLTISGVISDVNSIAGIDKLEIAFTPIEQVVALPPDITSAAADALLNRAWLPVTLAQRGAGVANTTWSVAIPADLENSYQIDLRGTDLLGNVAISGNVWRGVIDTRTPRTVMTATATGASYFDAASNQQMNEIRFLCAAQDRYLDEASFTCPGEGLAEPVRSFDNGGPLGAALQALFPDYTIRNGLAISYTLWLSTTTSAASVRACDSYGRCGIATTARPEGTRSVAGAAASSAAAVPGAPKAVIVNPTNGSFVAAGNAISVTVAAEAGGGLKDVTIKLDNAVVQTLSFAQSPVVTRTLRTVNVPVAGEGQHTLVAEATAWDNSTQTTLFPVLFTLDQNAPSLTIDASALTLADTWQAQSGVLRFNGNAGDSVGLAAVQIREGDNVFIDATFGSGAWRVALPVADPEGRTLNITVRAIDRAGRITQLNQAIATDLSAADAPDTSISSGPANPSTVNSAAFVFTGSATAAAFECQLDNGVYTPCASPAVYNDLSKGSHLFRVRAIDGRGLPDLTPAEFTWTINAGQPDATITGKPANPTTERTATFTFSGDATATRFECSLDGSAYAACSSPQLYNNLGNGEHTFLVRARNSANTAGAADRYAWTVTNLAPVANNQTVIVIPNQAKGITLTATDNEPLLYTIVTPPAHGVLSGVAPDPSGTSGLRLTYSPDTGYGGADSFTFRVSDGLAESNVATVTLFVDNVPPVVTCSVTPNNLWPPNHKLIATQATVTVADLHSGPNGFTLVSVTSSEADAGLDSVDVPVDIQNWVAGTPDVVGQVRAERAETGTGRTYTLTYQGKDLANNKALCTTTVRVPKSQGGVAAAAYDENQVLEDAFIDATPVPTETVTTPVVPENSAAPTDTGAISPEALLNHLFLPVIVTGSADE